jgi:spore germination protein KC
VVEKELKNVIDVAQTKINVDFLGMGELFYKSMPNYWKKVKDDWGNIFPNMQIDIVVEVEIQHTGLISDPSKVR